MKMKEPIKLIIAAIAVSLLFACANPPKAEMDNAIDAVSRAENDADAVLYGANSLARAKDALNRMQTEADSKRYDAAKTFAAEAISAADKAIADGRAGAVRARDDAASLIAVLGPGIDDADRDIKSAKSAGLALDYNELDQELGDVRYNKSEAENSLAANQYQDALDKGRNAQAGLSDINFKLSTAATAVSRKK